MDIGKTCNSNAMEVAKSEDWQPPEVPEKFTARDDASVNWVVRKICESRSYAQRCTEWNDREQRRAKRDEEFFLFRFGPQLVDYARRKMTEQGNRRKSVALPAGTLGFRKEAAKIVIDDETEVIAWAKEHKPELVTVIEKISKSGLNEHVEQTGELPEKGIHIEPEHEKFYVK